jgi:hypothetical protein
MCRDRRRLPFSALDRWHISRSRCVPRRNAILGNLELAHDLPPVLFDRILARRPCVFQAAGYAKHPPNTRP